MAAVRTRNVRSCLDRSGRSTVTGCEITLRAMARVGHDSEAEAEPPEGAVPEDDAVAPRRSRHRSGDRGLHHLGDFLLHRGAPLLQRVRHRPHIAVVEVCRVLEAQGRVAVAELARVLEEDDDLAVRVRVTGIPYQVFGDNSGAVAVTVTCTRSASARSCGAISAMLSRTACRPSACLAPFLPSARNSAARSFIAARSSALKPPDSVWAFFAGIFGLPFLALRGSASCLPSTERLGPTSPWRFSIPDRIWAQPRRSSSAPPSLTEGPDLPLCV